MEGFSDVPVVHLADGKRCTVRSNAEDDEGVVDETGGWRGRLRAWTVPLRTELAWFENEN